MHEPYRNAADIHPSKPFDDKPLIPGSFLLFPSHPTGFHSVRGEDRQSPPARIIACLQTGLLPGLDLEKV